MERWLINPGGGITKRRKPKRSNKRRKRSKSNPFLTIANGGKMTRKKARRHKKRYASNRRRRRGGLSLAPRHVTIVRNRKRRHSKRRHLRRNPGRGISAGIPRTGSLLQMGIGVVGGFAGPFLIEPMIPYNPTSAFGLFGKRAIAGAVTGIAGGFLAKKVLRMPRIVPYLWAGIGANLVINLLETQSINIPGFSGVGNYMPYPGGGDVERLQPYLQ